MKVGFIDRDGRFIDCQPYYHIDKAEELLKEYGYEEEYKHTRHAGEIIDFLIYYKGFIHIQADVNRKTRPVVMNTSRFKPSPEQIRTLRRYLTDFPDIEPWYNIRIDSLSKEEAKELLL